MKNSAFWILNMHNCIIIRYLSFTGEELAPRMSNLSSPPSSEINIIGDIFADIIVSKLEHLPKWGTDTLGKISTIPGGSALNTTLHAAYYVEQRDYRNKINIFSAIGNDSLGKLCRNALGKRRYKTYAIAPSHPFLYLF